MVKINFQLSEKETTNLLKVLSVIYNNNGNTMVKSAIGKLYREVSLDYWMYNFVREKVYKMLSSISGKTGFNDATSLQNGLQISQHNMIYVMPKNCNKIILQVAKMAKIPRPNKKITHLQTTKCKKVKDVINLILKAYE